MKLMVNHTSRILALAVAAAVLVTAPGCSKSKEEAGKAAVAEATVPDKPEEVVKSAAEAIRDDKPVAAYALLPESYQKDIQGVVSHATGKLDKEIFELGAKLVTVAASCAEKHADKIAGLVPPGAAPFDVKEGLAKYAETVKILEEAKLLDYESVKGLDLAGFLAKDAPKLMKQGKFAFEKGSPEDYKKFQDGMKSITATAKSAEGDKAQVELKMGEEEAETIDLVKVEGRWVPAEMAEGWKGGIDEAKKGIDEGLDELNKNKAQFKPMLEAALAALTEFEKSGDPKALEEMMKMM